MSRIKPISEHSLADSSEDMQQPKKGTSISKSVVDYKSLAGRKIPPHESILEPWFREGSLGYIFGLRGSGKTWFAWKMAISISKGEIFGPWKCDKPWKTLYVDGEMPLRSMQERLLLLDNDLSDELLLLDNNLPAELYLLSHEDLADKGDIIFNLCKEGQQEDLLEYCVENRVKVIFLDNLSCLCFGMKENEADSWEKVLGWLLRFRRAGIAVVIVHHANRDGNDMRGTSRREDAAFWVIKISQNSEPIGLGTAFTTTFTKNRDDDGRREKSMDWTFVTTNGRMQMTCGETNLKVMVYELIANGIESNKEIASSLGISPYNVSRLATKLIEDGLIKKHGPKYIIM